MIARDESVNSTKYALAGERAGTNFKRRGYAPTAPTTAALLHARTLAARRIHNGPDHDAFVAALCAIVARGLGRTIERIRGRS